MITWQPPQIFTAGSLSFIFGVILGYFYQAPAFILVGVFLLGIIIGLVSWSKLWVRWLVLILLAFILGFWRYNITYPDYTSINKIYYYLNQEAEISGRIISVERRVGNQKIIINTQGLRVNRQDKLVSGKVLVSLPLYPEYWPGQRVVGLRLLVKPKKYEDFDYEKYLARYKIYTLCQKASLTVIDNGGMMFGASQKLKMALGESVRQIISEPQASLLLGLISGDRSGFPAELNNDFTNAGITHIVAISGANVAILVMVLFQLFLWLGISRSQSFWLVAFGVLFFSWFIGDQASAIRAGVMALMLLFGQKIGRPANTFNILLATAGVMILFNPRLLFDIGFQLSFAALAGIIYLLPYWPKLPNKLSGFNFLYEIIITTLSAQIMTFPLLIFYFHQFPLISFLANLLILPIIPFITIWGMINGLVSLILPIFGQAMGFVSYFLLVYIIKVAHWCANFSMLMISLKINVLIIICLYALIALFILGRKKYD
ncbi:MAG: ComEC/Rec2 family competence protein [bacterium]